MTEIANLIDPSMKRVIPGRFLKGTSGNPHGRPKGSKNKITALKLALEGELRTQIREHMADILAIAIEKAKEGDSAMIKLLLDKTLSSSKPSDDEDVAQTKVQIMIGRVSTEGHVAAPIEGEAKEV